MLEQCTRILLSIENTNISSHNSSSDNSDIVPSSANKYTYDTYLEILHSRYKEYKERKDIQTDEQSSTILSFPDFVALCAISSEKQNKLNFLFRHTKLSYSIMLCHQPSTDDQQLIEETVGYSQFKHWASKLYPLATKHNIERYVHAFYARIVIVLYSLKSILLNSQ